MRGLRFGRPPCPRPGPHPCTTEMPDRHGFSARPAGNEDFMKKETVPVDAAQRLIQLRHPAAACDRLVVDDGASEVTVQYTCRGRGYGRTHIRRETNRLVQIDSQGIAEGLPFSFAAEARRIGDCPA